MDKILLEGLQFFGRHGCHDAERELGQKFIVDIELECNLTDSCGSDDLNDTIDYVAIYNAARDVVDGVIQVVAPARIGEIAFELDVHDKFLAQLALGVVTAVAPEKLKAFK